MPGTVYVDVTAEFAGHGFGTETGYAHGYYPAVISEAGIPALRK